MTPEQFAAKWHHKLVKPIDHYNIPVKEYFVTSALLDKEGGAKWAIMATDYNKENKQFITFDLIPKEVELLEDRFEILGDYDNIESESVQNIVGEEIIDGEPHLIIDFYHYPQYVTKGEKGEFQLKVKRGINTLQVGDKLYFIMFRATTGELRNLPFNMANRKHESNEEIHYNMQEVRGWIRSGLYHFMEYPIFVK